jgi:hypothetical protein
MQAHQITVATQYILQNRASDCKANVNDKDWFDFEVCSHQRGVEIPHFQYWSIVFELESLLNVYVRFQTSLFHYVLDALTELVR